MQAVFEHDFVKPSFDYAVSLKSTIS